MDQEDMDQTEPDSTVDQVTNSGGRMREDPGRMMADNGVIDQV